MRVGATCWRGFGTACIVVCAGGTARASEVEEPSSTTGRPSETEASAPKTGAPWKSGPPRLFVSAAVDIGFQYLRPRVSAGYGVPHDFWVGADANPIVSGSAAGGYSGLRFAHPMVDLRAGARYYYGFRRSFLRVEDSYDREDIEFRGGDPAQYYVLESELTLTIPVGPGVILSESAVTRSPGVPDDRHVYLESVRVVTDDGWIARQRLGYGLSFLRDGALKIGAVGEVVRIPGRDLTIVRGGAVVRLRLFDDLEVRANLIPVLKSRDSLGASGGDFGQLGIRWRWATSP